MSLKSFHLVFVTVASLLFAFLILWAFVLTGESGGWVTALGVIGIGGLLLMPLYGFYFLRKARSIQLD
ncbi:MAG TPA: hypothetical protein VFY13_07645 [Luteolibacter sp.]|nr:hypothetical protein [Luteolibacter sp.]